MKVVFISFFLCCEMVANKSRTSLELSHSSEIGPLLVHRSGLSLPGKSGFKSNHPYALLA